MSKFCNLLISQGFFQGTWTKMSRLSLLLTIFFVSFVSLLCLNLVKHLRWSFFWKIVSLKLLTISANSFILDICLGFEYVSQCSVPKFGLVSLRGNCPYSEFFWPAFSSIWTEYGDLQSKSPYSVQMWENADQKYSKYWKYLGSVLIEIRTRSTAQKFSIKYFFSKCDQICSLLWIGSHFLKESLMENFIFCGAYYLPIFFKFTQTAQISLIHLRAMLHSYRNQPVDLNCKLIDWFLYECNIGLIWFKK